MPVAPPGPCPTLHRFLPCGTDRNWQALQDLRVQRLGLRGTTLLPQFEPPCPSRQREAPCGSRFHPGRFFSAIDACGWPQVRPSPPLVLPLTAAAWSSVPHQLRISLPVPPVQGIFPIRSWTSGCMPPPRPCNHSRQHSPGTPPHQSHRPGNAQAIPQACESRCTAILACAACGTDSPRIAGAGTTAVLTDTAGATAPLRTPRQAGSDRPSRPPCSRAPGWGCGAESVRTAQSPRGACAHSPA